MQRTLLLLLAALSVAPLAAVVVRSYNKVDFFEFSSLQSLKKRFFESEGERASTNILLGVADEHCMSSLEDPSFRSFQRHAAGKTVVSASLPLKEAPESIRSLRKTCAELYFYHKGSSLNDPPAEIYSSEFDYDGLQDWMGRIVRTSCRFFNDFDIAIDMYWHDEGVASKYVGTIKPGDSIFQNTFIGHIFSARKQPKEGVESSDDLTVDFTIVDGTDFHFHPNNKLHTCDLSSHDHYDYDEVMISSDVQCDDMALRLEKFKLEVLHSKRLGLNYLQPARVPSFTNHGFEKRRLPEATYSWLKEWYDKVKEEGKITAVEGSAGPCMNQVDSPSVMHMITPQLKQRMAHELRPILEEWYGHGKLKMTSIYGIRKYTNGSVLRMHVDTANTHVISAIINVDQDVDEPWRLLILDLEENEHWIEMEPGDMVLYESAKVLHGRPEPMKGERYENIFLHYMPVDGWNYY